MRISYLLGREPFGSILEKTLSRFLTDQTGFSHEVRWHDRPSWMGARGEVGAQVWYCNYYLNALFVRGAVNDVFGPIRREFQRSTVRWREPFQRAYVGLATSSSFGSSLAQACLLVTPGLRNAEQLSIVGGNHKIRLLDHARKRSVGILKEGFEARFFETELRARRLAEECGVPVPMLEDVAKDKRWFVESYVSGTPLNRIPVPQQAKRYTQAATALLPLVMATEREEPLGAYVDGLVSQLQSLIHHDRLIAKTDKELLLGLIAEVQSILDIQRKLRGDCLKTAVAHGDFQPANVLVDRGDLWLIDWEYAGRRQVGYDLLVFGLNSRHPLGLPERLGAFIRTGWAFGTPLSPAWTGLSWNKVADRTTAACLFLLEDLVLYLTENDHPLFRCPSDGLMRWIEAFRLPCSSLADLC